MQIRRELKANAQTLLAGNWGTAIKLNIVPVIFQVLTGLIVSGAVASLGFYFVHFHPGIALSDFTFDFGDDYSIQQSFISGLITTYLLVGVDFALIDWLRTELAPTAPFKKAFQAFTGKYIIPVFVLFVIQWVLLFLWTLLLFIPGIIKSFSYSQTYYLYKDLQEADASGHIGYVDYVTLSRRLMDGHKLDLFILRLSFIGWDILGWLTCGIGFIWITPYKHMTYMNFYTSLVEGHDLVSEAEALH